MESYTIHRCEICGNESYNEESIINCENQGIPEVLVKKGDRIKFKDCDETPLAKSIIDNPIFLEHNAYNDWYRCYLYGQQLTEYEVIDIKRNGHSISYYLGKDGHSTLSWSYDWVNVNHYPVISSNEFMRKVLELYN